MQNCAKSSSKPLLGLDTNVAISHFDTGVCVKLKDAKTGNLVLLDVRNANNTKEMLTVDWEASYQLGTVASSQVDDIDDTTLVLYLVMWEPYFKDETNKFRPLWVENALRAGRGQPLLPSYWPYVVRLP